VKVVITKKNASRLLNRSFVPFAQEEYNVTCVSIRTKNDDSLRMLFQDMMALGITWSIQKSS